MNIDLQMRKTVEQVLPNTDFGRELIYRMSLGLDLPISLDRVQVHQIKRLRPFQEIKPNQIKKVL